MMFLGTELAQFCVAEVQVVVTCVLCRDVVIFSKLATIQQLKWIIWGTLNSLRHLLEIGNNTTIKMDNMRYT
jgi:hypothetical protein